MGGPTAARQERLSILRQHIFCVTRCKLVTFSTDLNMARSWFLKTQKAMQGQFTQPENGHIQPATLTCTLYTAQSLKLHRVTKARQVLPSREAYNESTHHGLHTWAHSTTFKVEPQHRELELGYFCNVSPSLVNSASEGLTVVEKTQWPGPTNTPCHWVGLGGHCYDDPFSKAKAEQQQGFIVSL